MTRISLLALAVLALASVSGYLALTCSQLIRRTGQLELQLDQTRLDVVGLRKRQTLLGAWATEHNSPEGRVYECARFRAWQEKHASISQ